MTLVTSIRPATIGSVLLVLSGCTTASPPSPETASFANVPTDPALTQQISADAAWLGSNKLPEHPAGEAAPQAAKTCPSDQIADRGKRQMQIPNTLATVLVSYEAKPWAFVRYDLDDTGTPLKLKIEKSSGLKSFDQAAIETVKTWRFDFTGDTKSAKGCIADVFIS